MVNEIAQWAVLVFLAVCALGLTRQLGRFIVPQNEQRADEFGPPLRGRLPDGFLDDEEINRLDAAITASDSGWAVLVVLDQQCEACEKWVEGLEQLGKPQGGPLVAVTKAGTAADHARLERVVDLLVVDDDGHRTREADLRATPFLVIVDARRRVVYKQLAGDLFDGVERWRRRDAQATGAGSSVSGNGTGGEIHVVHGGRT